MANVQTTKVTSNESSPERSRYMHVDKQITQSILVMLFSMKDAKTAKVEGLWLVYRPKCLVSEGPDDSPKGLVVLSFYRPSLNSMNNPCDGMK